MTPKAKAIVKAIAVCHRLLKQGDIEAMSVLYRYISKELCSTTLEEFCAIMDNNNCLIDAQFVEIEKFIYDCAE